MSRSADSDASIDWTLTTWEGSRREQLRRWAGLPLARTIAALEEMGVLAEALRRAGPTSGVADGTARPAPAARAPAALVAARGAERERPRVDDLALLEGNCFWKMSGGGNDFVVLDNRAGGFPKSRRAIVAALCARGLGVGADAVLLLEHAEGPEADFRMVYYNADGSEAPMCGNGALCIARFAREIGVTTNGVVCFETGAGLYRAELFGESPSRVRLIMREPHDVRTSIPEIEARGYAHAGFVDTGTPHLIVLVADLATVDVACEGMALRRHAIFEPQGLNVSFVAVLARGELAIRTYERGVEAETLSCGTGATAAAILTHLWGLTEPPVVVHPPGGFDLTSRFQRLPPDRFMGVTLEGDARIVFRGSLAGD